MSRTHTCRAKSQKKKKIKLKFLEISGRGGGGWEKKFKVERRKSRRLVAEEAMLGCASSTPATNTPTSAIGAGPLLVQ